MKGANASLICTVLVICLLSCQKKENAVPMPHLPTSVVQTSVYPYIDTFTGVFTETQSFDGGMPGGSYTIDSPAVFYVEVLNANTMVFISRDSIRYDYGAFMVRDTFMANRSDVYWAAADTSRKHEYTGDAFNYFITSVYLTYNWSYNQPVGCGDEMIYSRTFSGMKIIR